MYRDFSDSEYAKYHIGDKILVDMDGELLEGTFIDFCFGKAPWVHVNIGGKKVNTILSRIKSVGDSDDSKDIGGVQA